MKVSVVIPMYNEEEIVVDTVTQLVSALDVFFPEDYELIFSDDGSSDASVEKVKNLNCERVRVIESGKNYGKGHAVRQGVLSAEGDYVMFTDCDLAYGVDIIRDAVEVIEKNQGKGMMVGSRRLAKDGYAGYSFMRKFISRTYLSFLSFFAGGLPVSDSQTGCKIFTKDCARRVFPLCEINRFAFDFEIILFAKKMKIGIGEFPVTIINNRPSSIRFFRDSMRMIRDVLKIRRRVRRTSVENVNP